MYRNYHTNYPTEYQYACDNCRKEFDEPEEEHTTYEHYYGVSSLFPNSTPMTLNVCPYCSSDDIIENDTIVYDIMPGERLINRKFHNRKPKRI